MLLIRGFKARFQLGSNDNLFDFTYVKNVAHGHLLAAEALLQTRALGMIPLDTERVDGEAFFITNGTPVYFWDFMRQVLKESGREPKALDLKNVFVLGTGIAIVLATLAEIIMGLVGKSPNFSRVAVRSSSMTRYFSIDKARTRLRYEPIVSLEDGIRLGVKDVMARQAKLGI
jgi:sterol-4alpha-carboxylate 3-dehydrogenase (decarboxylating)